MTNNQNDISYTGNDMGQALQEERDAFSKRINLLHNNIYQLLGLIETNHQFLKIYIKASVEGKTIEEYIGNNEIMNKICKEFYGEYNITKE